MNWRIKDIPNQAGRTILVTGANSGLGLATTQLLTQKGAHVIMACRSIKKAILAQKDIEKTHPPGSIDVIQLDLSDLNQVYEFSSVINSQNQKALYSLQKNRKIDLELLKTLKSKEYVAKITV